MKLQLIKYAGLNDDKFILLSDEELSSGNWGIAYDDFANHKKMAFMFYNYGDTEYKSKMIKLGGKKIVASEFKNIKIPLLGRNQKFECKGEQLNLEEYWDKYKGDKISKEIIPVDVEIDMEESEDDIGPSGHTAYPTFSEQPKITIKGAEEYVTIKRIK